MKKRRKETYGYKACLLLGKVGVCYKSDMLYYIKSLITPRESDNKLSATSSRVIRALKSEGVLNEYSVGRVEGKGKGDNISVLSLTKKGRNMLLDLDENTLGKFPTEFRSSDYNRIATRLDNSTVAVYMASCGVPTFPSEKPSLYHLFCSGTPLFSVNPVYQKQEGYLDGLDGASCMELLRQGLYYSKKEILTFLAQANSTISADQVSSSRIKGIFLSDHNMIVIYRNKKYRNKLIKVDATIEKRLLFAFEIFNRLCGLNKRLTPIESKINQKPIYNSPRCLVLTNTDDINYHMCLNSDKKISIALLGCKNFLFERTYAITDSFKDHDKLKYLFNTSLQDYLNEAAEKVRQTDELHFIDPDYNPEPLFVGSFYNQNSSMDYRVVYIPLIECKLVNQMASDDRNYVVVATKEIANTLARAIGKEHTLFYDSSTLQKLSLDDYLIYDAIDQVAGIHKLAELLAENGKHTDELKSFMSLPEKLGKSFNRFYNAIYKRTPTSEQLATYLPHFKDTDEAHSTRKQRIRRAQVSMTVNEDFKKKIALVAKSRNMSVNAYLKSIISPIVSKHEKERLEKIKSNQDEWNK